MASNYGQKKPDSYDANVAGAKRYGPAATGRGPNVGKVSASGRAGYRDRDRKLKDSFNVNNPAGERRMQAEARRNALLRRMQAEHKGAHANPDALRVIPDNGPGRPFTSTPGNTGGRRPLPNDRMPRVGGNGPSRSFTPTSGNMSRNFNPPRRRNF